MNDPALVVQSEKLIALGESLKTRGDFTGALANFAQARREAAKISARNAAAAKELSGLAFIGSAAVHGRAGSHARSAEDYTQALAIARELGDREREGEVLGSLAVAHEAQGQYGKAIEEYTAARAIANETGNKLLEAQLKSSLKEAKRTQKAVAKADVACYKSARKVIELSPSHEEESSGGGGGAGAGSPLRDGGNWSPSQATPRSKAARRSGGGSPRTPVSPHPLAGW